ncbi:MAG: hypothetical protein R3A78_02380 [Polyangiales bacterium]|nr:hypothetical protein [Myxococcales bacterium]
MTSIKPPGGPKPTPDVTRTDEVADAKRTGESFRTTMDTTPPAAAATPPAPAASSRATAAIVEDLRAGRIDRDTAIARVVESAMGAAPVQSLSPKGRAELEGLLRDALAHDPALRTLLFGRNPGADEA